MPFVETSIEISGDPAKSYEIGKDMESYPNFMKSVNKITTVERGENYTITDWNITFKGRPMTWIERDEFDDVARRIDYQLVKGDLKKFEGTWTFESTADGGTRIVLTVDFEFGLPMFSTLLNPLGILVIKQNCEAMLQGIKQKVEGTAD